MLKLDAAQHDGPFQKQFQKTPTTEKRAVPSRIETEF